MIIRYCKTCEIPMRPSKVRIVDAPGTAAYGCAGQCWSCYRASLRRPKAGGPNPQTLRDLEVFMRRVKRAGASKSPLIRHLPVRSAA